MANFVAAQKRLFNLATSYKQSFHLYSLWLILMFALSTPVYATSDQPIGLIFTAEAEQFEEVVSGIVGDLEEDLTFKIVTVNNDTTVSDIGKHIKAIQPSVIVLVENRSVSLYQKYQSMNPNADYPPSVSVAALFVDRYLKKLKNATAIRYEIPAVTSIVNMRSVLGKEIKKVGVVHREWMKPIINQNKLYCQSEDISLVSVSIPNNHKKLDSKLKSGIDELDKADVDAIWVLNDNVLLQGKMLGKAWIPKMKKLNIPVIVGVDVFLRTELNFGSFAIVPDHYNLGVQAASIIGEIMEDEWQIGDRDIEQPVSVKKIINTKVLNNKKIKYQEDKLGMMDKVIR